MKLFTRYNRVNIAATIFTFVIGSVAFYFVLRYVLLRQLDETLKVERQEIINHVKEHQQLPDIQNTKQQWIDIAATTKPLEELVRQSVPVYDTAEKETEAVRQLIFSIPVKGQLYRVTVNHSETETEDLLQLIILVTIAMIAFILASNYLINRRLVNRLWKPFYTTIDNIRYYQLAEHPPLQLPKEPIDEIDLLNDSLNKMTARLHQDYFALRTFTENASHEMQTPLAIIRSRVESLLQDSEMSEKNIRQLLSIEDTIQKLARLNHALLLLAKLENRQFRPDEVVDLHDIIQKKMAEREELFHAKRLSPVVEMEPAVVSFHQHLADILVSNLLNNMIRYTPDGGEIILRLNEDRLSVQNTAVNGPLDEKKIFQRFYKENPSVEGTGLGLAIVYEICRLAGFGVSYTYTEQLHNFTIQFTKN